MKKAFALSYKTFPGGLNTVDSPFMVGANKLVGDTVNAMLLPGETKRRPGMLGFQSTYQDQIFSAFAAMEIRSFSNVVLEDGSIIRIVTAWYNNTSGKIYSISDAGAATVYSYKTNQNFPSGNINGNILMVNNKIWLANGARFVKLEPPGTTAYYVGMAPPITDFIVGAADVGGTLPDGIYKIKLGYYRKVDGVIVLYSRGTDYADVTLDGIGSSSGVSRIDIQPPAPGIWTRNDNQMDGMVVWMTDAGGSVYYQYATYDIAPTDEYVGFTIYDATNKNASLVYDVEAVNNWIPTDFTWVEYFNYRMWGVDPTTKHRLWYSMFASNVYDLERYPAQNYIDYPFEIISVFALGSHLYVNTKAGLIRQPFGDPSVPYEWADKKYFFQYKLTVAFWHGSLIGLTNDGVRIWDGQSFSPDLSRDIKNLIANAYTSPAFHEPCGCVVRRNNRAEYHLSFMDETVETAVNNVRFVLNLDSLQVAGPETAVTAWEKWDVGAELMSVNSTGGLECVQVNSSTRKSTLYKESGSQDKYIYDKSGTWLSALTDIVLRLVLPVKIPKIGMRCAFNYVRALMRYNKDVTIRAGIGEAPTRYKDITV
jgi:hypothetical protein